MQQFISLGLGNQDFLATVMKNPGLHAKPLNSVQKRIIHANLLRRHRIQRATEDLRSTASSSKTWTSPEMQSTVNSLQADDHANQDNSIKQSMFIASDEINARAKMHPIAKRVLTESGSPFQVEPTIVQSSSTLVTRATQAGQDQNYPRWPESSSNDSNRYCPYCAEPLSTECAVSDDRWRFVITRCYEFQADFCPENI